MLVQELESDEGFKRLGDEAYEEAQRQNKS
jgi:hypothetical protein